MRIKKKIIFLLLIMCTLIKTPIVNAIGVEMDNSGSGEKMSSGPCGESDCLSWASYFRIRVALVDKNGNLAKGTKIVEIQKSGSKHSYAITDGDYERIGKANATAKITSDNYYSKIAASNDSKELLLLGSNKIKYYDGTKIENLNTTQLKEILSDKYYKIYIPGAESYEGGFDDNTKIREKLMELIKSGTKSVQKINGKEGDEISFLEFFLHVCGYSKDWNLSYEELKDISNEKDNDYHIVIEPIYSYSIRYAGTKTWNGVRGTAKQLAQFITTNSYAPSTGLFKSIPYNHMCNYYERTNNLGIKDFGGKLANVDNFCSNYNTYFNMNVSTDERRNMIKEYLKVLAEPNSRYGINIIRINEMLETENVKLTYKIDGCADNDLIYRGKLNISLLDDAGNKIRDISSPTDIHKYIYNQPDLEAVIYHTNDMWCYDEVEYDFSDIKKEMDKKTYITNQIINAPEGTLTVIRKCYTKESLEKLAATIPTGGKFKEVFNFRFNDKNYTYKLDETSMKADSPDKEELLASTKLKIISGYVYTQRIKYKYKLEETINESSKKNMKIDNLEIGIGNFSTKGINIDMAAPIKIADSNEYKKEYTNYIEPQYNSFKDSIGLSNKLLIKASNSSTVESNNKIVMRTHTIDYEESINKTCKFTTTVKTGDMIKFRTIDLNNPFPARDGISRLPGKNWLYKTDNFVDEYITNNRGVKTTQVYNKKPLYIIELTPSTMIKIRGYNMKNSYTKLDITCEAGTGRMCIDNFIRNTKYISELQGTCSKITKSSSQIEAFNKELKEYIETGYVKEFEEKGWIIETHQKELYNKFDTNKDKKINEDDYKNQSYYTCADKTRKSGG